MPLLAAELSNAFDICLLLLLLFVEILVDDVT